MRFFTFWVIFFCTLPSYAALSADVYRIEFPVADQTEVVRNNAIKAHLADVIVRVAGDAQILQNTLVSEAINNAPSYLQQFSYTSDTENKTLNSLILVLTYSSQAIDKLLMQARISTTANSAQAELVIRIDDVQDFASFKQVQSYLKGLAFIRRCDLRSTNKDSLEFSVTVDGGIDVLTQAFAAGNKLLLANTEVPGSVLQFRWQR